MVAKTKLKIVDVQSKKADIIEKELQEDQSVQQEAFTEVEMRLHKLLKKSVQDHELYVFPPLYEIIKQKVLFDGDLKALYQSIGVTNKSTSIYPLIDSVHDSSVANLYDTTITAKAIAREEEDLAMTQSAQDFFDWCYDSAQADFAKELIRNEASLIGTSYGIAGFTKQSKKLEYLVEGVVQTKESTRYVPTLEHVPFFCLFTELSTTNFYKARWKAMRKIYQLEEIKDKYGSFVNFDEDLLKKIKDSNNYISTKDHTKIYEINMYANEYINAYARHLQTNPAQGFVLDNLFTITKENQLCEVIEFWEKNSLIILVNGRVIYDGVSPYPMGSPFGVVVYEEIPGTFRGRGIGHKLMTHQKQASSYYNRIKDAISQHIDPMYVVGDKTIEKNGQTPERIFREPGKVLKTKEPGIPNGGIKPLQLIDFNIVNLAIQDLKNCLMQAQEIIGTNAYAQGGQGKVERSFGAVQAKLGVVKSRLQPIIKSINRFDNHMFEQWLSIAAVTVDGPMSVRVLGEKAVQQWSKITPIDLLDKFDIVCDSEAARAATKAERAQTITTLLQTIAPINVDQMTGMPIASVPDLLKELRNQLDFDGINILDTDELKEMIDKSTELKEYAASKQPVPPEAGTPGAPAMTDVSAPMPQSDIPPEQVYAETGVVPPANI